MWTEVSFQLGSANLRHQQDSCSQEVSLQGSHLLRFTAKVYLHPQNPWMTSSPPCTAGPQCVCVHLLLEPQAPNPKSELMII